MLFLGVDLGWITGCTGLAALQFAGAGLELTALTLVRAHEDALRWIEEQTRGRPAMVAIDAPTIIRNASGQRPAERALNADFRKHLLSCHPANLGRPFAAKTNAFAAALEQRGFRHAPSIEPRASGRYQIEVFPHGSIVRLFGLDVRLRYKKGTVAERTSQLEALRGLIESLRDADPPLIAPNLPTVAGAKGRARKGVEDRLDAVICAYTGAHYWYWGAQRNQVFGDRETGYLVVPANTGASIPSARGFTPPSRESAPPRASGSRTSSRN